MPDGAALIRPTESRLDLGFVGRVSVAPPDMYWLRQLSNPGRGFSSPHRRATCEKKPAFACELFFKYGGEGGIDSLRSPLLGPSMGLAPSGPTQALFKNAPCVFVRAACSLRSQSVQLAAPVVEPRSGVLIPPQASNMRKKSPHLHASSSLKMAVRGGFEPPIRCRIHTFQACSFSHSDTSPYCHPVVAGTGANVRKSLTYVNQLFQ